MKTTFKVNFQEDVYELKGNSWGKEVLYRNNEILLSKRNIFKPGNEYEFDCPKNGRLKLIFNMDMNTRVINIRITKEEKLLAEYVKSMDHLVPEWVKKIDQLEEDSGEDEAPENSKKKVLYGLISLAAAMLIWSFMFSWVYALVLIIVLLIHELGHYTAMAILGYKKKGILFAPPLGAVAYGVKKNEIEKEKLIVLLSGPLPGILIGLVLFFSNIPLFSEQLTKGLALQFLIINYINLLPISPLDGGKIVEIVFLHKFPKVQLLLAGLGLLFIGGYGIISGSFIMILVALIFAFLLYGRIHELKNEEKAKDKIEATNLSTSARVVVGLIYLALLILLLFLLNI